MTTRRFLQAACLASAFAMLTTLSTTRAHADDAGKAEALARFNEGLALVDSGKFEEARLKFLQSLSMLTTASTLFNLAGVEARTGHDIEAIEHHRAFLKLAETDSHITDQHRERSKQVIQDLLKKVGQIDIHVPPKATVSVDGKALSQPLPTEPVVVSPGKHKVESSLDGKVKSTVVDAEAGQIVKANLDAEDSGAVVPPTPSGEGERSTLGWVVPITLGAIGVAGVVTGAAMGASSQSSKSDAEALRQQSPGLCADPPLASCGGYEDKRSSAQSSATISWIGYVSGGVLIAASIATFVFWPKSSKAALSPSTGLDVRTVRVVPVVSTQGGGASVRLSF